MGMLQGDASEFGIEHQTSQILDLKIMMLLQNNSEKSFLGPLKWN